LAAGGDRRRVACRCRLACRCELKIEAINRLSLHFLFAAQFPLAYLVRINTTMERLLDLYG
jgi:hypothetical protein